MKKILVTGGCGFIGSHTSYLLAKSGIKVIILDSNINSSEKVINCIEFLLSKELATNQNLEFVKGDIRDEILVKQIFEKAKHNNEPISSVIHFTGLKSVAESVSNPLKYWDANVQGSIKLLQVIVSFIIVDSLFSPFCTNVTSDFLLSRISPLTTEQLYAIIAP